MRKRIILHRTKKHYNLIAPPKGRHKAEFWILFNNVPIRIFATDFDIVAECNFCGQDFNPEDVIRKNGRDSATHIGGFCSATCSVSTNFSNC